MQQPLTDGERDILIQLRDQGVVPDATRAQIVLLTGEDLSAADIAKSVPIPIHQIRYWRREWDKRRLEIFPSLTTEPSEEAEAMIDEVQPVDLPAIPGVTVPRLPLELRFSSGVLPDDPMAEAGRKILLFQFERMLSHEPGSRTGTDIESVHDMRVATRRMRSAMQLFRVFFKKDTIRAYRSRLSKIADALGEVRDLDVMIDKAQGFAEANPGCDLTPLIEVWEKQLNKSRRKLITQLDSKKFAHFVEDYYTFLVTPGMRARKIESLDGVSVYQVKHIAPRLILEQYEQVRAYETVLAQADLITLHALRIEFKRLRYALEFFEEVLGPEAKRVIKEVKIMQDHLGDLQDARVVGDILNEIVDRQMKEYSGVPVFMRPDISGVLQYTAATEAQKQDLIATMPAAWENFLRNDVRRDLALALAAL
jgi:CHAD domain-containing protein